MKNAILAFAVASSLAPVGAAHAQGYPLRPVRILVGVTAGSAGDIAVRILAGKLTELWGKPVLVENRPGATLTIAADIAAKATPDGYTLHLCGVAHTVTPAVYKKLPYDHLRDFAPISLIGTTPNVLVVHPAVPATTVKELVAYAKSNPGKIRYGSSGIGSTSHLTMEMFRSATGIELVHVPYKGSAAAHADLLGGQVQATFENVPGQIVMIKVGRVRALGVTSAKRAPQLPAVPTMVESGIPDFEVTVWYGICTQAAVPQAVVAKLNVDVVKALNMTDVRRNLDEQGISAAPSTAEAFAAFLKSETMKWAKAARDAGAAMQTQ